MTLSLSRRTLLASGAAALLVRPAKANATGFVDYTPGMVQSLLGEGRTVFVDYAADWCGTCKRQERVIDALIRANPAYQQHVSFVRVDWDDYRKAQVTTSRNIPRRSTLLVLKGDRELGRIVAGTGEAEIKSLMDTALQAATNA